MEFIEWRVCGVGELSYRSDAIGGDRDTAFAEGMRFVGLQLQKVGALPMEILVGPVNKDDA